MITMKFESAEARQMILNGCAPDNLSVGGFLDLRGTQITALPDNLSVGGFLDLRGTQITALPDNLSVGRFLDLEGTQITALPEKFNGRTVNDKKSARPYLEAIASAALADGRLNMSVIHSGCGTSHCIAGWAQALFPEKVRRGHELVDAINLLGWDAAKVFFEDDEVGREFLSQFRDEAAQ